MRLVRVPRKNPDAWRPDEVARLLRAAERAPGEFRGGGSGIQRAALLKAWLLVGYYTLLRPGDLLRLEHGWIGRDGEVVLTQSKTGESISRYLPAMEAVRAIRGKQSRVFPIGERAVRRWWDWLTRHASAMISHSPSDAINLPRIDAPLV